MKKLYLFLLVLLSMNTWGFNGEGTNNIKFNADNHIPRYDIEEHFVYHCDQTYSVFFSNFNLDQLNWSEAIKDRDWSKPITDKDPWWAKDYIRCLEDASYISPAAHQFIKASNDLYASREKPEIITKKLNDLILKTRADNKIDVLLDYELTKIEINSYKTKEEYDKAKEKFFKLAFTKLFKLRKVEYEIDQYIFSKFERNDIEFQNNSAEIFYQLNNLAEEIDKFLEYRNNLPKYYDHIFSGRYAFFSLAQFYLNKNNPYFSLEKAKKYLAMGKKGEEQYKSMQTRLPAYYQMIQKNFDSFDRVILEYQNNNNVWADYLYQKVIYGQ
mgnify:CR=1 FL=1